jgi:hypothetical protein
MNLAKYLDASAFMIKGSELVKMHVAVHAMRVAARRPAHLHAHSRHRPPCHFGTAWMARMCVRPHGTNCTALEVEYSKLPRGTVTTDWLACAR